MKIVIVSSDQASLICDAVKKLDSNLQVSEYNGEPMKSDIVVFADLELSKISGDKNIYLDKLRDSLALTNQLILANLSNEWVSEIIKEVMKMVQITVLDYDKNDFGEVKGYWKAVYTLGLNLGYTRDQIEEKLNR